MASKVITSPALEDGGKLWPAGFPGGGILPEDEREGADLPPIVDLMKANASGVMVALMLSKAAAEKLAVSGGEPADTLHLTLAYLGSKDEMPDGFQECVSRAASRVAADSPPITGTVSGIGRFVAGEGAHDKDVAYASFDAPVLSRFRERLIEELEREGVPARKEHGFTPHITLAYMDKGSPTPKLTLPLPKISFKAFALVIGDTDRTAFRLSGVEKRLVLKPDTDPAELSTGELLEAHRQLHLMFRKEVDEAVVGFSLEGIVKLHARVVRELLVRKVQHPAPPDDGLDEQHVDSDNKVKQMRDESVPFPEEIEVEKYLFGYPAGKAKMASKLLPLIPEHKVYIEPFAGSAAIFFGKEAVAVEVLNDRSEEVMGVLRAVKMLTDAEVEQLQKKNWVSSKPLHASLRNAKPEARLEKVYRYLYLSRSSFYTGVGGSYSAASAGTNMCDGVMRRIEKARERFHNGVKIMVGDYEAPIKEHDSKDAFVFLDPPYPGYNINVGESEFDEVRFRKILQGIKGKFLVTYGAKGKLDTSGFHVRKVRVYRSLVNMPGVNPENFIETLLISNFKLPHSAEKVYLFPELAKQQDPCLEIPPEDAAKSVPMQKPFPNEHAARQTDPSQYDSFARTRPAGFPEGIDVIFGIKDGKGEAQSVRAKANKWTVSEFRTWLKDHDFKTVIEEATAKSADPHMLGFFVEQLSAAQLSLSDGFAALHKKLTDKPNEHAVRYTVPIIKVDEEKGIITGVVLEPEERDAQGDIEAREVIARAAYSFLARFGKADGTRLGIMHKEFGDIGWDLIESWIQRGNVRIGKGAVKSGSWLMSWRRTPDAKGKAAFARVKRGELNGFSIGGLATTK